MTPVKGGGILFSEMTPPEQDEAHFNEWYFHHHMPSHVYGVPGFLSGQRYRAGNTPHYLAIYELASTETLQDPEYRTRKYTPDAATRSMLARVHGFTRYVAREVGLQLRDGVSAERALGSETVAVTLFSEQPDHPSRWEDGDNPSDLACNADWQATRLFQIVDADPEPFNRIMLHYLDGPAARRSQQFHQTPPGAADDPPSGSATRQIHYDRFGRRYRKNDPEAVGFSPRFIEED